MRYYISWTLLPVPPEMAETAWTLLKASREYSSGLIKKGKMREMWNFADGTGGMALIDADSNDDLFNMIQAEPYSPFLQFSVTPLSDVNLAYDTAEKQFKQMLGK